MDESDGILEKLYEKLYVEYINYFKTKRKNNNESLLINLLKITSNSCMEIIAKSKIQISQDEYVYADSLVMDKYATWDNEKRYLSITVRGIYKCESNIYNIEYILDALEEIIFRFNKSKSKPLRDIDKVIIFSMVALRALSKECPIDLQMGDITKQEILSVLKGSNDLLFSINAINDIKDIGKTKGNEHPASYLFRYTEKIKGQTNLIYHACGDRKYYLKIFESDVDNPVDRLVYLFKLIGCNSNWDNYYEVIAEFMSKTATHKNIYIFDPGKYIYLNYNGPQKPDRVIRW